VLLTGETGTGKTLAARILHREGARRSRPFVAVNCAGIPGTLFETEVFGHERGAFTGAVERRRGVFETAHQGTLFLDELGELAVEQQAKLLTVLDDGVVRRVGAERAREVDVRLVSATSRNLPERIRSGAFRADLFHRVAVLRIRIPPLRERSGDIPLLARHFLDRLAKRHRRPTVRLTPGGLRFLEEHPWPGNLRELVHVLEAALVLSRHEALDAEALREVAMGGPEPAPAEPSADPSPSSSNRYSFFGSEHAERERIRAALELCQGNKTRAARLLGMSRTTLRTRVRRFALDPSSSANSGGPGGAPPAVPPGEEARGSENS